MAGAGQGLKVVSANRLDTGAVVWLDPGGGWVERVAGAVLVAGPAAEAALERAQLAARDGLVVEPYLVDVELEGGSPRPIRPRERVRACGPSVRPDLAAGSAAGPATPS